MSRIGAVVVAVFATALLAQEQAPRPRFRAGVTFVQVDVSVLDRDRVPVRGLSADEFTVAEDGRPQKIVTFQEIDVPAPEQPPALWMREVAPDVRANDAAGRRLFVLVLDDGQVEVAPLMTARGKEIGRRIIDQLGPNDLAAVVFTKNNSGAQDFTNDRARLLRAVNAFAPGRLPAATVSPHLHIQGDRSQTYFDRSTVGTLGNVAKYLTAVQERRKALIYISVGVPVDFRNFRGDSTLAFETQHAVREAQRANVNIYAIDPSGLALDDAGPQMTAHETAGTSFALRRDFLRSIAADTGGLAILDRNEFAPSVTQIFRENGSYYLLGYESPNPKTDGKFRKIDVRVGRSGLTARARRGYYGPPSRPEPQRALRRGKPVTVDAPASDLNAALAGLLPQADVAMQAFAAPFGITGRREAAVAIVVGLLSPARPERARREETIELLASAYGPEGEFKASTRETVRYVPQPENDRIEHEFVSRLDLKPGRYSLRLAAKSAALGKAGSVFYDVDVPDFSRAALSLSGLVLSAAPGPPAAPRDRLASLLPVTPTTRREFNRRDRVTAFLRVYQGGKAPPAPATLAVLVTDGRGATVLDAPQTISSDQFAANRAANFRFDLPLAQLAPGPYLLTVEAALSARATARRDVRFVVR